MTFGYFAIMSEKLDLNEFERLFLALGDKTRLRLLALMAEGEVSVGFLADRLGESQPKVSRHLAYLRNAGVVETRRDGKWIYYGICYPDDASQKRILDTILASITATSGKRRKKVYFTEEQVIDEATSEINDYIYGDTDMYEADNGYNEVDGEESEYRSDEIDIFLL